MLSNTHPFRFFNIDNIIHKLDSQFNKPDDHPRYPIFTILRHIVLLILCGLIAFSFQKNNLLLGYDGNKYNVISRPDYNLWWFTPRLGITPIQGLGEFLPRNGNMPSTFLSSFLFNGDVNQILLFMILSVELFLGCLFLCHSIRVRFTTALLACWGITLLTLPYLFQPIFYPVTQLVPNLAEMITFYCLTLGLFIRIGKVSWAKSILYGGIIYILLSTVIISNPPWFLLQLPALFVMGISILTLSESKSEIKIKLFVLLGLFFFSLPTIIPFFSGTVLLSVASFFSPELSGGGREAPPFFSVLFHTNPINGSFGPVIWILSLFSAILVSASSHSFQKKIARAHILCQIGILIAAMLIRYTPIKYHGPATLYYEFFLWPFFFIYSAIILGTAWDWISDRFSILRKDTIQRAMTWSIIPVLLIICILAYANRNNYPFYYWKYPPRKTNIVNYLIDHIGLKRGNGASFHGIVATYTGLEENAKATWAAQNRYDYTINELTRNDHRATGLWEYDLPTLFTYNQMMSPSYYLMMTRFLARPFDEQVRNVIVLSKIDPPYLSSIGVRYLISDHILDDFVLVEKLSADKKNKVYLYQLEDVNLGTYSPTKPIIIQNALEALNHLKQNEFDFKKEVVVDDFPHMSLMQAQSSDIEIDKYGIWISAQSDGTSFLLLPFQYSHCLEIITHHSVPQTNQPTLIRANIMQAGLLFSRNTKVQIRYRHSPFENPFCRLADYMDMRRLQISNLNDHEPPTTVRDLSVKIDSVNLEEIPDITVNTSDNYTDDQESSVSGKQMADGSPNTYWSTSPNELPAYVEIKIDLGKIRNVGRVSWLGNEGFSHLAPNQYNIFVSEGGEKWQAIFGNIEQNTDESGWVNTDFSPRTARYIKIVAHKRPHTDTGHYIQLSEISVSEVLPADANNTNVLSSINLRWTMPKENWSRNAQILCQMRMSKQPIQGDEQWTSAQTFPHSVFYDTTEEVGEIHIYRDEHNLNQYYALRCQDDNGNRSEISNSVHVP